MTSRIDWERGTIRIPHRHAWWLRPLLHATNTAAGHLNRIIDAASSYRDAWMTLLIGARIERFTNRRA